MAIRRSAAMRSRQSLNPFASAEDPLGPAQPYPVVLQKRQRIACDMIKHFLPRLYWLKVEGGMHGSVCRSYDAIVIARKGLRGEIENPIIISAT